MKRIGCLAGICLLAALLGPWQMEAAAEEQPVSQGAAASSASGVITYEDLETLVKAYCPQVQMERIQYESRINRYEAAREEIMETRRLLREEASDMEKSGDQDGADHYYAQAKTLEEAAKEIDKQLRSARGSTSTMSYRKMEDTHAVDSSEPRRHLQQLKAGAGSSGGLQRLAAVPLREKAGPLLIRRRFSQRGRGGSEGCPGSRQQGT